MGFENLGPNVSQNPQKVLEPANGSGQYTAEDHSFEQLVIQQDRPAADWEVNLLQAILGPSGVRRFNSRLMPSGWINPGFLEASNLDSYTFLAPDTSASTTANVFQLAASGINVNGWMVHFDLSQAGVNPALPQVTPGVNYIVMPAPPAGGQRTDFVILEVWRALISPMPNSTNKSQAGQILRYGNAKCPDVSPNENLADDLIDPIFAQETARRVQIQYRYRVITGPIDIIAYPDGLDAPSVTANSVPTYPSPGVDGASSGFSYVAVSGDSGLWRAGSGDQSSVTILGTVDGYMYAIPICAVTRRNTATFNRLTNLNGAGLMGSAFSGRPDGLYADQIVNADVLDMRKGIAYDFTEVLQKVFEQLLDNTLETELEVNQTYGLSNVIAGTSFLFKDDISNSPTHPGSPDGVRYNFSDRASTQSIGITSSVIVGPTSTVVFSMSSIFPAYPGASSIIFNAAAPAGTNIIGFNNLRIVTSAPADIDLLNTSSSVYASAIVYSASVSGGPIDTATITLNAATSNFTVYADIEFAYPSGFGTSRNVTQAVAFWTPPAPSIASWVDATQLTATSDAQRFALTNPGGATVNTNLWWMSPGHRELSARLRTTTVGPLTFYADSTGLAIWIPEKLTGIVNINDGINPPYTTTGYTQNTTYTQVTLTTAVPGGTAVVVSYTALRPVQLVTSFPNDSYQIWYITQAIQSIPLPHATTIGLPLYSRSIAQQMHLITSGSGSPDDPFPYVSPSCQIPVGLLPPSSYPESRLDSPNDVSTVGFGINSGYLALPAMIPYSPDPGQVQLYVTATDETIDGDNRNFWPRSDPGTPPVYSPVAWGQSLSLSQRHKVALPVLMELKTDFNGFGHGSIGRKGTLVLVVFSRWGDFDPNVNIGLQPALSDSAAAVYRVPGNLMNPRRVNP